MFGSCLTSFFPKEFANLALWLDAANPSNNGTRPADGASITTWTDVSGNSNNGTQSTASFKPTYKLNILNGLPCLRFDGNDTLVVTDNSTLDCTSGLTLFVVAKPRVNENSVLLEKRDSGGGLGWQASVIMPVSGAYGMQFCSSPISGACVYSNASWTAGTAYSFAWYSASNATLMFKNGVQEYSDANNNVPTDIASSDLYIGSYRDGSSFYDGDIFEIILYSVSLSSAQRGLVLEYLRRKWALY